MQDPNNSLPRLRCAIHIITPRPAPNVVAIEDVGHDTRMSVINDVEAVVERLYVLGVLRDGDSLIYKDSNGNWDGIDHKDGRFMSFTFLRANGNFDVAVRIAQRHAEENNND